MLENLYKDTIQVLRNTRTADGGGTYTETEVISSTIRGLIVPVGGKSDFKQMQASVVETTHRCYTSNSSSVLVKDKLRSGGITYEVLFIESSTLGSNPHQEIELNKVN
jgi:hypothetical protein